MESEAPSGTPAVLPPSKAERELCWLAKDAYWSCLSTTGKDEPCAKLREDFETNCKKAWVKHFDRQREFQKFKAAAEKKRNESS